MAYNDLLLQDGVDSNFLVVMRPAVNLTSWTNVTGNINYSSFTWGYIVKVEVDGVELVQDNNTSPTANKWYWDNLNKKLYLNYASISSHYVVAYYELYYATVDFNWYRDPLDVNSGQVYYEPYVVRSPSIKRLLSEIYYGYMPSQSTSITIGNPDGEFEKLLYDSSFYHKDIEVYHLLGDIDLANIKIVINGIGESIDYATDSITFSIVDRFDLFDKTYQAPYGTIDDPVRTVYGIVDELKLKVLDPSEEQDPTLNRQWRVCHGPENDFDFTITQATSAVQTKVSLTSTFYINNLKPNDYITFNKGTPETVKVVSLQTSGTPPFYANTGVIFHEALVSGLPSVGQTITRETISNVFIDIAGVRTFVPPSLYTKVYSSGILSITFINNFEATLGIDVITQDMGVFARVYSKANDVTIGGNPFYELSGSVDSTYKSLTSAAVILFELIKSAGIPESEIDLASFETARDDLYTPLGFSIPQNIDDPMPTYKELFTQICQTALLRLFVNDSNKWAVKVIQPISASPIDNSANEDEIVIDSIAYSLDFTEVYNNITVSGFYSEFTRNYKKKISVGSTHKRSNYLHKVNKTLDLVTLAYSRDSGLTGTILTTIGNRYMAIFGDRQGRLSITVKNNYFNTDISDIINIELQKLLGYPYVEGVQNSRKFTVIDIEKSLRDIKITLDDQKGIEDNSGSW
jgi:hypothetical protein